MKNSDILFNKKGLQFSSKFIDRKFWARDAQILSKRLKRCVTSRLKMRFKNPWVQVSTLGSYAIVAVAKLKILVYWVPQRKKGKSHFENRRKAHDAESLQEKYSSNS